jgi:hypothetical protein
MKTCKDLNIKQCLYCRLPRQTIDNPCWIVWFKEQYDERFLNPIKAYTFWFNREYDETEEYFIKMLEIYYPDKFATLNKLKILL